MWDYSQFDAYDPYTYELDFLALANGATASQSILIQADSNFLWQRAAFHADIAGAAFTYSSQPIPNVTLSIQDAGSGRVLMSSPVPVASIFGLGHAPSILDTPRLFRANTQFTVTVSNFDAAVTYNLRLSFLGTKCFSFNNTGN